MMSESLRRHTVWGKPKKQHDKTKESIAADVEAYLKSGGKVEQCGEIERAPDRTRGRAYGYE